MSDGGRSDRHNGVALAIIFAVALVIIVITIIVTPIT